MRFRISLRADADVDEIWPYIAQNDPAAADRVEQDLHDAMHELAARPGLGHQRRDASPRYRFWRVHSYLIAYYVEDRTVVIARVLHAARDIGRFLGGP